MTIRKLEAREILDSRGIPTVEVSLYTERGKFVSAVPSGGSTGSYEAKELRDGGSRYMGKGVNNAVKNVNEIIFPKIKGREVDPKEIDETLSAIDGTEDKSSLGANAILGVSMSVYRAAAKKVEQPLYEYISSFSSSTKSIPRPCFNVINGGVHAGGNLSFQEFMIVPQEDLFSENLRIATESYHELKSSLKDRYGEGSINVGDEGGFVPEITSSKEALACLDQLKNNLKIFIDAAASEFFDGKDYKVDGTKKNLEEIVDLYKEITEEFNVVGLEDPLNENDFQGWAKLRKKLSNVLIIGDDLLVTNLSRIEKALEEDSCNAVILKINQIGSVTEAIAAAMKAKSFGWKTIVSHRSGETSDSFIADFAVGIGADYIKAGAPARGERVAKYNRLLEIEKELI